MDAEIKQKWVTALRSGKYKQGRSMLHDDGHYCCLGVLCALVRSPDIKGARVFPSWQTFAKIGMSLPFNDQPFWTLAGMNDSGKTFREIADHIEGANL